MQLNFKKFGTGFPLVILHGLMGSLDNWQMIAKQLSLHFEVFIIDQRNHGRSPHSKEFSYELLVADLLDFLTQQGISKAHILGHSMGGKVAMSFALKYPDKVSKLVIVDIAPTAYESRHTDVFQSLFKLSLPFLQSRSEAEEILRLDLKDESTVQFLMKSLYRTDNGQFAWRFNLDSLHESYEAISDSILTNNLFEGETLFIKGAYSNYINASNFSEIITFFPHNQLEEISNAGHWVHAENPMDFMKAIETFLLKE